MSDGQRIRPPTREEELAYLDRLEQSFRKRRSGKEIPPRPTREFEYEMREQKQNDSSRYWTSFFVWGFVGAPVACWLALKAPSKIKSFTRVPFQAYKNQHRKRFWGYFTLFDLIIANYGGQRNRDWKTIMSQQYQVAEMRKPAF